MEGRSGVKRLMDRFMDRMFVWLEGFLEGRN